MIWTNKTIVAAQLTFSSHEGQTDKLGVPYIFHLIEVAEQAKSEEETIVSLLHDFLEDIHPEMDESSAMEYFDPMFGRRISLALIALKHDSNTPYMEYLKQVAQNELAFTVKKYDMRSNSNPQRLALLPEADRIRLTEKYSKALDFLNQKEG